MLMSDWLQQRLQNPITVKLTAALHIYMGFGYKGPKDRSGKVQVAVQSIVAVKEARGPQSDRCSPISITVRCLVPEVRWTMERQLGLPPIEIVHQEIEVDMTVFSGRTAPDRVVFAELLALLTAAHADAQAA
jgi:hypothetical protein